MEAGSSEPSLNDEFSDEFQASNKNLNNQQNGNQVELQKLTKQIQFLKNTINELILTLQDDFDQLKNLPQQRISDMLSQNEEEEEDYNSKFEQEKSLILEVLHIYLVNAENIQAISKDINSAIQASKDYIKQNPTYEMLKEGLDLESDSASETFREESKVGTRNSSLIKSQLKEAEEEKIAAQHKINQLKEEIAQLQYSLSSSPPTESGDEELFDQQLQDYYDGEMERFQRIYDFKVNEQEEMKRVEQECIETQNELDEENRKLKQDLQSATDTVVDIKRNLTKLSTEIERFRMAKIHLEKRNKQLNHVVSGLENAQSETNQRRMRYEQEYQDHQSVVVAYKKAEEIMQQNRGKQDEKIAQMIDAVQIAEKKHAELQRYKSQCESYHSELKHIEEVIAKTKKKVNEKVSEMEQASKAYYSSIQVELFRRIEEAKLDNQNLVREKEFLETQIKREQKKNQTLKENSAYMNHNEYCEAIFKLNKDVDSIYQQMNQQRISAIETKRKISNMNGIDIQSYTEKLQMLKRNAQQIQIDISTSIVTLRQMKERNSQNENVNIALQQYIKKKKEELEKYETTLISQRNQEIEKLKKEMDQTTVQNQKDYISIENEINNIISISKAFKEQRDDSSISVQSKIDLLDQELGSLEKVQKKLQRQVKQIIDIKFEIDEKLNSTVHQIIDAQTRIHKIQNKDRRIKDSIVILSNQNISHESEIAVFQKQISHLDKEIEKQKREVEHLSQK